MLSSSSFVYEVSLSGSGSGSIDIDIDIDTDTELNLRGFGYSGRSFVFGLDGMGWDGKIDGWMDELVGVR